MASSKSWTAQLVRAAKAFARNGWAKRWLALEAGGELLRARVMTLAPTRVYGRTFGKAGEPTSAVTAEQEQEATDIGRMVERVARVAPFKAVCLQQAIATQKMLRRRRIEASINFGLKHSQYHDASDGSERAAHAWVIAGQTVVNGDVDLDQYVVVGRFH